MSLPILGFWLGFNYSGQATPPFKSYDSGVFCDELNGEDSLMNCMIRSGHKIKGNLKDELYQSVLNMEFSIDDDYFVFKDGKWEGKNPGSESLFATLEISTTSITFGDLDSDGDLDAVVLITETIHPKNSNNKVLSIVVNQNGVFKGVAHEFIGVLELLTIDSGIIYVKTTEFLESGSEKESFLKYKLYKGDFLEEEMWGMVSEWSADSGS